MTHGTIHGTAHGTAHSMSGALHCAAQRVWGSTAALTSPRPATCGYTLYSTISKRRSLHMHHARLQTRADFGGCACARTHTHLPADCQVQARLACAAHWRYAVWHAALLVRNTGVPPTNGINHNQHAIQVACVARSTPRYKNTCATCPGD